MTYTNFAIEALKHRLVEKAVKNGTPKKFGCDMFEAYEVIVHLQKQVVAAETDLAARQFRMALHGCCVECDFWDESDPRCMCDKSQWAGLTVKADNYCGCFERRNDLLTLEELLKRTEPVWCAVATFLGEEGYYCLCNKGSIVTPFGQRFRCEDIADWPMYDHKPGEAQEGGGEG